MSVQMRAEAPYPIWGAVPSPENIARFHSRWNKEGVSYAQIPVARWVELACKEPLLTARIALNAGMGDEIKEKMAEVHLAMQSDFRVRIMDALMERCATYDHLYPGFVGTLTMEKCVTDRLSAEVLADERWRREYAGLELCLRDWLMDNQARAGTWLDKSTGHAQVNVVTHTFQG
jgi:hypothetical protein